MIETFDAYHVRMYLYIHTLHVKKPMYESIEVSHGGLGGVWSSIATLSSSGHGARAWGSQLMAIFGTSQAVDLDL